MEEWYSQLTVVAVVESKVVLLLLLLLEDVEELIWYSSDRAALHVGIQLTVFETILVVLVVVVLIVLDYIILAPFAFE